ncbi:endonuclease/exonuclease/phosphatase family protein [Archangium violaceum]|uniref:endonuclease/exonuclease/phosphatase family protein n=1 Tax=Archangium violaceum TaxID=83451 RepID=UPI00193C4CF3|nr:endonuclease/exonuclease/phosphatase family protein [Archangium violaceum]QRK10925.1 endonuclease/exonuclease/phosphatase family protein [Archangium violaceum]
MARLLARLLEQLPFYSAPFLGGHVPHSAGTARLPEPSPTRAYHDFAQLPETSGPRPLGDGETRVVYHPSALPPRGPGLTVMTYNILMGGARREALERYFERLEASGRMPDIIGLQEANQPISVALARKHGFHLAYFGASGDGEARLVNGKALLSRHPLREAVHHRYALEDDQRRAAISRQDKAGELKEDRGALRAVLEVWGRPVSVYVVHHTLGDTSINASDLRQLHRLLHACGPGPAVVMGDFNANVAIKRDGTWLLAQLRRYDPTHTVEEYQARYGGVIASVGDVGVGNIGDPRIRRALRDLERELPQALDAASSVCVRREDGSLMTPKEARHALRSGRVREGTEAWRRLQDVADAATLNSEPDPDGTKPATGKRFDSIFATRDLRPEQAEVDQSTEASDHRPVLARYAL